MVPTIDPAAVLRHTATLSSDAFEGRAPGTAGEAKTVAYLEEQMRGIGLEPAGDGGTYHQKVPLLGITSHAGPLTCGSLTFQPTTDVVAWSKRPVAHAALERSDLVFVGYGVEAPEYQWDDFKGVDLTGKTMVVLVGDPPVPDPGDPSRLDPNVFRGSAMTYYGRWTCKMEMAARKHAAGILIVHETGPAGYPFSIVQGRPAESFDLASADPHAAVEGWLSQKAAQRLFALAGQNFAALQARAATRAFQPVPLGLHASIAVENTLRSIDSRNVLGLLRGREPGECVIYTAHWDHLGVGPPIDGETVRHGARDNAVAVGSLLELARAFATAPERPRRSVLFLAVTAEETGLLGTEHYVRHPRFPLEKTLAVLNFEVPNVYGRTRDLTVVGLGASDLDDYARAAAAVQDRVVTADPHPEQGWFYRSDHFPFARSGVPAMWAGGGSDYVGRPPDYGARVHDDYVTHRYHRPADRITPDWDLSGAVQDVEIYYAIGRSVADGDRYPAWKPGAEFHR